MGRFGPKAEPKLVEQTRTRLGLLAWLALCHGQVAAKELELLERWVCCSLLAQPRQGVPASGEGLRVADAQPTPVHQTLYGKNLPFMVTLTRSPLGSAILSTCKLKSIADMMPSPNFSWITSLSGRPYTCRIS